MKKVEKYAVLIPVMLIAYPVFFYYYNFFFVKGDEPDLNIFATVLWRSGLFLTNLEGVGAKGTYFFTHIAPVLYIPNALSYVIPISREAWFAIVMALMHGSLGALGFLLLKPYIGSVRGKKRIFVLILTILLAVLFAMNGIILRSLWIGHYEFIIPLLLIIMFYLLAGKHRALVVLTFVLLLGSREDAGLHAAIFLSSWILIKVLIDKQPLKHFSFELALVIIGSLYSLCCLFLLMPQLAGDETIANSLYFGNPPFSHISQEFIAARALAYLVENTHLYLPVILITGFAIFKRKWIYLAGVMAVLPWTLVHFLAISPETGMMYSYKAFPFLVVFVWPFLAERLEGNLPDTPRRPFLLPVLFFAILASGMFAVERDGYIKSAFGENLTRSLLQPEPVNRTAFRAFKTALLKQHSAFGRCVAAPGVARLHPGLFKDDDVLVWYYPYLQTPRTGIDTIFYQTGGRSRQMAEDWAQVNGHNFQYALKGSNFRISSIKDLTQLPELGDYLKIEPQIKHRR